MTAVAGLLAGPQVLSRALSRKGSKSSRRKSSRTSATSRNVALIGLAGATAGVVVLRRLRSASASAQPVDERWQVVTVLADRDQVTPGGVLPEPLLALGDFVDVQLRPAPGGRGTEIAARLTGPPPKPADGIPGTESDDPRDWLRSALRRSKQLVEVGEVLRLDPAPHGQRSHGPAGALLDSATARAGGKGLR